MPVPTRFKDIAGFSRSEFRGTNWNNCAAVWQLRLEKKKPARLLPGQHYCPGNITYATIQSSSFSGISLRMSPRQQHAAVWMQQCGYQTAQSSLPLIMCCFITCNMWHSGRGWEYIKNESPQFSNAFANYSRVYSSIQHICHFSQWVNFPDWHRCAEWSCSSCSSSCN